MTVETMKQLDEAQEQTAMARKQLDESMEKYVTAREASLDALRTHNEKGQLIQQRIKNERRDNLHNLCMGKAQQLYISTSKLFNSWLSGKGMMDSCSKCGKVFYYEEHIGDMCMDCWQIFGGLEITSYSDDSPTEWIPIEEDKE